jgi:putative ABC transport system substrate-binding protein
MNETRRNVCAGIAGLTALPRLGIAQSPASRYRLCWLSPATTRTEPYHVAFMHRLGKLGFSEGRNLTVDYRLAIGTDAKMLEVAADLMKQKCSIILAPGTERALIAAKQASKDTPIVIFAADYDPVATGHAASLARPGGRITGVSLLQAELPAKRLELLKEMCPKAKRIAVLADSSGDAQLKFVRAAAGSMKLDLHIVEFKQPPYDYESGFAEAVRAKADALLVLNSSLFVPAREKIPALALKHRLPAMFGNGLWADAGGLMSYAPNFSTAYRRVAEQVGRILKGANPAELPIEQPGEVELVLNLKTAKALA